MFHHVKVKPNDKNALKFLWWTNGDFSQLAEVYRMTVHLFGAKSSPSCAAFALKHASKYSKTSFLSRP